MEASEGTLKSLKRYKGTIETIERQLKLAVSDVTFYAEQKKRALATAATKMDQHTNTENYFAKRNPAESKESLA